MAWTLRYAPHIGFITPDDEPQFNLTVASSDPWDHVAFAAGQGFGGVLHPWIIEKSATVIDRFHAALQEFEMESGCIASAPLDFLIAPTWTRSGAKSEILEHLDRSVALASRLGAKTLAVILAGDVGTDRRLQEENAIAHLREAGDRAAAAGVQIGVEPLNVIPDMLLESQAQALDLLDRVDHPAVRLIFDTGHVGMMEGDVLGAYEKAKGHIGLIQLGDMPGRIEPGRGSIDFVTLLSRMVADGFGGELIELEHGWSEKSLQREADGIVLLREIDAQIRSEPGAAVDHPMTAGREVV